MIERDPITLAKEVASLDFISGGRVLFGIGGGWNREEMEHHGTNPASRWRGVRERIEAMQEIWSKDEAEYHGEFVNFDPIWQGSNAQFSTSLRLRPGTFCLFSRTRRTLPDVSSNRPIADFDSLDRTKLKEMLGIRVADGSLMRRIRKCLHVGVRDGETMVEPELGTAQGSVLPPLLGNAYLHYVLDLWFETEVKPRLQGEAIVLRYCDNFIIGFEREDDARRVVAVLDKRMVEIS